MKNSKKIFETTEQKSKALRLLESIQYKLQSKIITKWNFLEEMSDDKIVIRDIYYSIEEFFAEKEHKLKMSKKHLVEIGEMLNSFFWVSKNNKIIWRYDIEKKKMYRGNFKIYCSGYFEYFIKYFDRLPMFHDKLINYVDNRGNTALFWSAKFNNIKLSEFFIEKGIDVNAKNKAGNTALIWASSFDNTNVAKLLIENGADVNAKNNDGNKALTYAYMNNNEELANLLLEKFSG